VLPRPAWVVLGGDFLSAVGSGLTLPCLFLYAHRVRDLSYGTAGLVVATIALASLAGNPVGGAMADRYTPRRALMAGLILAAAGSAALALARTPAGLFAAAGLTGLGVSLIWPAQDALLASLAGPAHLSAVFSVRHATMNAGLGLGAVGAAAVVSVAHPATFTVVYLTDAASFLAFLPMLARLRTSAAGPAPADQPPPATQPRVRFRQVLADTTRFPRTSPLLPSRTTTEPRRVTSWPRRIGNSAWPSSPTTPATTRCGPRRHQPSVNGSRVPPVSSTQIALVRVYSRTASMPFSRPRPDSPNPPNGTSGPTTR
jgi:MFS family permease